MMGIALQEALSTASLTPSPTRKGYFLETLQLRASSSPVTSLPSTPHQPAAEMSRNAEGRCSASSQPPTAESKLCLGKKHISCTELGLKEERRGTSQSDWL